MEKRIAIEREGDGSKYIANEDRLSQLPQHILHHILSLLSQEEAVQTCILSKSWRHLWYGIPKVEFCESEFTNKETSFVSVVDSTLQRYLDQKLPLKELRLKISEDESYSRLLEKWIPVIMLRSLGVEVLELCFLSKTLECFEMPFSVFSKSESLEKLYLEGDILISSTIDDNVLCKHLQLLCLTRVYIADETFEKIMTSCPSIKHVKLENCEWLKTIKLINYKHLKFFSLIDDLEEDNKDYYSIDIYAPNIEGIEISGCWNLFYHHNYFPYLRFLILHEVKLSTNSFDIFSSNFPCLEKLELGNTYGYEQFRLSSRSIRSLALWCLRKSIKVTIDAPKILSFIFSSTSLPSSISFATTPAGHDWKSDIRIMNLTSDYASSSWLTNLNKLLKAVSQSQISLNFAYNPLPDWDIANISCGAYIEHFAVEHLVLTQFSSSYPIPDSFLNVVFRIIRPKYTYAAEFKQVTVDIEIIRSLCQKLVHGSSKTSDHNFWQRDLEQTSIEASEDNGKLWHPVLGLPECALSTGQKIRFRLTWRESS